MSDPLDTIPVWDEFISPNGLGSFQKGQGVQNMRIPRYLTQRRIYAYLEISSGSISDGEYWVTCLITANLAKTQKAIVPVTISQSNWPVTRPITKSMPCFLNSGGSPVGDSCTLKLANPFSSSTMVDVLQPLRLDGEWDNISMTLDSWDGIKGFLPRWRCWLGVLSTKP